MNIENIIKEATGLEVIDFFDGGLVDNWAEWYKGDVATFHNYRTYNGTTYVSQKRKTLNMPKRASEDWANLLLNEKTDISIGDKDSQENMSQLLRELNFWVKGNRGIEKSFALGAGAFVESVDENGDAKFQFVNRKKIYPLTVENEEITECAFANVNSDSVVIQIHQKNELGNYVIRTLICENQDNNVVAFFGDIDRDLFFDTESPLKWFQIIQPNIVNNAVIDSPFGVSIFANALDVCQGIDLAYDGFCEEMRLGKARVFVDKSVTRYDGDGEHRVFDNNDVGFYVIGNGEGQNGKPLEVYSPTLRTESFFAGINNSLNLFSQSVGFGANHYKFEGGGVATATQVISENSEMFRTLRKHEILLENVMIDMVRALMYICNNFGNGRYFFQQNANVEIKFDDSIIEDKESQKVSDRQDVSMGVMSKAEYRAKWYNEDIATAQAKIDEATAGKQAEFSNFFSEG